MDNKYENIVPWNGANDTGKDVRLKLERNFAKIGINFDEVLGKLASADDLFALIAEELENKLSKVNDDRAQGLIDFLKGLTVNGDKASIDKDGIATVQQLIALVKAKVTDLEITNAATAKTVTVSDKVTTLNLLVQKLAEMYDLKVSNVATLFRTIIKDYVSSETFIAGLAGEGFKLYKALSGDWNLELDNLTIRKGMTVFELIISKIRAVNGGLVVSQANGRVKSVDEDTTNYILAIEGDMTFVADDLVRCQVFGSSGAKYYWVRVSSVSNDSIIIAKSEFSEGTVPAVGDDLVQMGNKTNTARQGILYLTASEDGKPRFSVLDSVNSTDLTGKNKLILGCLDGITDSDFPSDAQPSGYGLWAVNVFLKGLFILRNGKSIEDELNDQITAVRTAFEIREGQISSKVTEATVAATNAGNSAVLAQGYASAAGQKASAAAGSATDAANILTVVTQKETSIKQTADAIELKAVRAESAAGRAESAEASINLKADGIVLQASNQAAKSAVDSVQVGGRNLIVNSKSIIGTDSLTLDLISGSTYTFSMTARTDGAYLFVHIYPPGGDWGSDIFPPVDMNSISGNKFEKTFVATTNGQYKIRIVEILGNLTVIKYPKLELGTKATDWTPAPEDVDASIALRPTTEEIKSQFTIDSSGISMMGKKIALTGLITFSSLASDAQTKITSAQSTAESALDSAGTANQSIGTLQNSLGQMAYQNMVSLAKLDNTIVEGGYLKTSLINANAIITNDLLATKIAATDITTRRLTVGEGCMVGGFSIGSGRIGISASPENIGNAGMFLYADMIGFNSTNRQAIIGTYSVLGYPRLGQFIDTTSNYMPNVGLVFDINSTNNGGRNYAFVGRGHGVLNGFMCGYAFQELSFTKANQWQEISKLTSVVGVYGNYSNWAVVLPTFASVCEALNISYNTPFQVQITVFCTAAVGSGKFFGRSNSGISGISGNQYPALYNWNADIDDGGYAMGPGDSFQIVLWSSNKGTSSIPTDSGSYRAYIVNKLS